jgi:hypothetical protein
MLLSVLINLIFSLDFSYAYEESFMPSIMLIAWFIYEFCFIWFVNNSPVGMTNPFSSANLITTMSL